jgi:hypothetical protein
MIEDVVDIDSINSFVVEFEVKEFARFLEFRLIKYPNISKTVESPSPLNHNILLFSYLVADDDVKLITIRSDPVPFVKMPTLNQILCQVRYDGM